MPKYNTMSKGNVYLAVSFFCILSIFLTFEKSQAVVDYVYYSIDGDTTASSMTQGSMLGWGSNCDIGTTIYWEIWFDENNNSTIDEPGDVLLTIVSQTDGDLFSDADMAEDGFVFFSPLPLYLNQGTYIFRAYNLSDFSSAQKALTVNALVSPPNQITGTVSLPGVTAPDDALKNIVLFAESEGESIGIYSAITDNNGNYMMNMESNATGLNFRIRANPLDGYVNPPDEFAVVSGVTSGVDLSFLTPVDSVYGTILTQSGDTLPVEAHVRIRETYGNNEKEALTKDGRYAVNFTMEELGEWAITISDDDLLPNYLIPSYFYFDHDTIGSFQKDITVYEADTFIYAQVTESGSEPSNNYLIGTNTPVLNVASRTVSKSGLDNITPIPVSSLDMSSWIAYIIADNDLPFGNLVPEVQYYYNVSPGDTVTFNMVTGVQVDCYLTGDPADAPVMDYEQTYVSAYSGSKSFATLLEPGGVNSGMGSMYTDTGTYTFQAYSPGFLFTPSYRIINIQGNYPFLFFNANLAHCKVTGTIQGIPLPLNYQYYQVFAQTDTSGLTGYQTSALIDSVTGTFEIYLSDGEWMIPGPYIAGPYYPPDTTFLTIGNAPDTVRNINLVFTSWYGCCVGYTGNVDNGPDDGTFSSVDVSDAVYFVDYMFRGGPAPVCEDEANVTGSLDGIDIVEIVYLVDYMFRGGPEPVICP